MSASSLLPPVSLADFEFLKVIGKGYSGLVYLALERLSREPVAVKIIKKSNGNDSRTIVEQEIQQHLSGSTFVVPLLASWHDADNFYLVSPFHGGRDLGINLAVEGRFKEDRARFYAAELLMALEEMKVKKILHRDLKPANIVFDSRGHVRLIDMGFATKLKMSPVADLEFNVDPNACSGSFRINDPDYTSTEQVGTASFMSPDQHLGRPYSYEADLHALGVTIYQMITGRLPFGEGAKSRDEVFEAVLCEHLAFKIEDKVSSEARDLLGRLLERDSKRPAQLEEIIEHPWFAGVPWDRVRAQTLTPSWKPHISPLPKKSSVCMVKEGAPCLPDPYPNFTYISPELVTLRTRGPGGILNRLSRLFSRDQSPTPSSPPSTPLLTSSTSSFEATESSLPLTPPASPWIDISSASSFAVRPPVFKISPPSSPLASETITIRSVSLSWTPPPTPPPTIPLPPLPTEIVSSFEAPYSPSPLEEEFPAPYGDLPPLHIRQLLMKRPRSRKHYPIRGDMTRMPQVIVTPVEDQIEETASPDVQMRLPFGDVTNQRFLSPSDAERPSFNPVVKSGPRIKLAAPPKRVKRAQKENAGSQVKEKVTLQVKEDAAPQVKQNAAPQVKEKATPQVKQNVALQVKQNAVPQVKEKATPQVKQNAPPQVTSHARTNVKAARAPTQKENAPPKANAARASPKKENAPPQPLPQIEVRKVTRTPPTAVFMIPPKVGPLPLIPGLAPSRTPPRVATKSKPQTTPKTITSQPLSRTSPPKSGTPKTRPAFKVPVKVTEPKANRLRSSVRRSSTAKDPASPVSSPRVVDFTNPKADGVYPRPMARAVSLSHPALAFVDTAHKPSDYPRPPDSVTQRKVAPLQPLSIQEAFAPPPPSPPGPKGARKTSAPALTFTSAPQACRTLTNSSATLSKESLARVYGFGSPRINLNPHDLKYKAGEIIERIKTKQDESGSQFLAHTTSPTITVGPHYAGYLPGPSPTGIISDLKRLWIRLSMAVSRAVSWLRHRGEPGCYQF